MSVLRIRRGNATGTPSISYPGNYPRKSFYRRNSDRHGWFWYYLPTLGIAVAVKEFFPAGLVNRAPGESVVGLLSGDKQQQYRVELKRFLMEAQSIAQFGKAKDIVNVYAFFEENNTAYIIMEYIDGVLLKIISKNREKWNRR